MATVLVTEWMDSAGVDLLRREHAVLWDPRDAELTVDNHAERVDAILTRVARVSGDHIRRASRLKVIAKHGVGVNNIDVAAATERRIPVAFTPEANSESVAEHTLLLMLALARRLPFLDTSVRGKLFRQRDQFAGSELLGKTVGIVGMGHIGSNVARRCAAFGMRVLGFDAFVPADEIERRGASPCDNLQTLLRESDFLTVHCPLTPQTYNLIAAPQLAQMKPSAYVINTARGGIVDEDHLADALNSGAIAGAALDAFETEPPDLSRRVFKAQNTIFTPHVAGGTAEALVRMSLQSAEAILAVLAGGRARWTINPEVYP